MVPAKEHSDKGSCKSKATLGYAVGITIALIIVVVLGSVYYFKSLEIAHGTIVKFHQTYKGESNEEVTQETEVDVDNQIAVFHLDGDGMSKESFVVFDYGRSMIGLYEEEEKSCYLVGGLTKDMVDLKAFLARLYQNSTDENSTGGELDYVTADDYPISDKSILPKPLQSPCKYLPTFWLELAQGDAESSLDTDEHPRRVKRRRKVVIKTACYKLKIIYRRDGSIKKMKYKRWC